MKSRCSASALLLDQKTVAAIVCITGGNFRTERSREFGSEGLPNYNKPMGIDDYKLVIYRNQPDGWVAEIPAIVRTGRSYHGAAFQCA